jgi:hypothetical protein
MRTTFDVEDILYTRLKNDATVTGAISGKVYKNNRPVNSNLVDIVIGSLPMPNEQLQRSVANVNVHAPNLKLNLNGVEDNSQPDRVKLKQVTSLVITSLKDNVFPDYYFDVQQQNMFASEDSDEHYSNIRVNFFSENL